jgi:hypothetical protein
LWPAHRDRGTEMAQATLAALYEDAWTCYPWAEMDFATIVATEAANRVLRPLMVAEIRLRDWVHKTERGEIGAPARPLVIALAALGERQEAIRAEIVARVRLHVPPSGDPELALHAALDGAGLGTASARDALLDAGLGILRDDLLPLLSPV